MTNALQEQMLKAGLVTEKQVKAANTKKKGPKKGKKKGAKPQAPTQAQIAAQKKAERDRELNRKREEQARKKAISVEIDKLIRDNALKRGEECELVYQFEHRKKVHRLYVNAEIRQRLLDGKLAIGRIDGRYEIVPSAIGEKVRERNEQRIVFIEQVDETPATDDPYADYQVPDDLMW